MDKFNEYRSLVVQLLHKEGLTNFAVKIDEPSEKIHQCQIAIQDNEAGNKLELIVVRGEEDIKLLMPGLIKKIKELRGIH